jgi:hypothetical protein
VTGAGTLPTGAPAACNAGNMNTGYTASAAAVAASGMRHFATNTTGTIFYAVNAAVSGITTTACPGCLMIQ